MSITESYQKIRSAESFANAAEIPDEAIAQNMYLDIATAEQRVKIVEFAGYEVLKSFDEMGVFSPWGDNAVNGHEKFSLTPEEEARLGNDTALDIYDSLYDYTKMRERLKFESSRTYGLFKGLEKLGNGSNIDATLTVERANADIQSFLEFPKQNIAVGVGLDHYDGWSVWEYEGDIETVSNDFTTLREAEKYLFEQLDKKPQYQFIRDLVKPATVQQSTANGFEKGPN